MLKKSQITQLILLVLNLLLFFIMNRNHYIVLYNFENIKESKFYFELIFIILGSVGLFVTLLITVRTKKYYKINKLFLLFIITGSSVRLCMELFINRNAISLSIIILLLTIIISAIFLFVLSVIKHDISKKDFAEKLIIFVLSYLSIIPLVCFMNIKGTVGDAEESYQHTPYYVWFRLNTPNPHWFLIMIYYLLFTVLVYRLS